MSPYAAFSSGSIVASFCWRKRLDPATQISAGGPSAVAGVVVISFCFRLNRFRHFVRTEVIIVSSCAGSEASLTVCPVWYSIVVSSSNMTDWVVWVCVLDLLSFDKESESSDSLVGFGRAAFCLPAWGGPISFGFPDLEVCGARCCGNWIIRGQRLLVVLRRGLRQCVSWRIAL
jgi:hypothetical protein